MKKALFILSATALALAQLAAAGSAAADTNTTSTATNAATNTNFGSPGATQAPTASAAATPTTTSQTPAPAPRATSTPAVPTPAIPKLVQQIQQAKAMLQDVSLNYAVNPVYKTVKVKVKKKKVSKTVLRGYVLSAKDAAFAILDPSTGQISITKAMQQDRSFTFPDKNYSIKLTYYNGVNSRFSISNPPGGILLAWKILISNADSAGSRAEIVNNLHPSVYVPYSPGLSTPEVSKYGENYLNTALAAAVAQLQNQPSVSIQGQTITQAIKPSIIKALLYAEHMDTNQFIHNPDTQSLIDQVNVLYAGNENNTFNFSVSTAGARGIAQFIPSTYASLVDRHPEANLNPDFVTGMSDHVNAIKAEYLLIDDYIAAVRSGDPVDFNPAYVYDYGAASYNGGVARVVKAVSTYGQNWDIDHNSQIDNLQSQIDYQNSVVRSLRAQIRKTKPKAAKADLNGQLATAQNTLASLNNQLGSLRSATLRTETILYLDKMRKLIQVFNGENVSSAGVNI